MVVESVRRAGANPCPPIIVGVGVGGSAEKAMWLAKRSLLRTVGEPSPDPEVADLEAEILERVNRIGIGPQGFGGLTLPWQSMSRPSPVTSPACRWP